MPEHHHASARGIASAIYYPVPLHLQECFRGPGPPPLLPVAEALAAEVLSIPVFPELTAPEQAAIVHANLDFWGSRDHSGNWRESP